MRWALFFLAEYANPEALPELAAVRDRLRDWRFYDGFRVDRDAPARRRQVGTRTPVLSNDGNDLAAAVQTILKAGFDDLPRAVAERRRDPPQHLCGRLGHSRGQHRLLYRRPETKRVMDPG